MADVNATFNYDADFSSAITQTRLLSRELSVLNNSFNSLDKDARKVRDRFAEVFKADVGDLGAFSARTVDITSNMDNFGKALDRNKLKLRDYAREARKAFQSDSNSRKLAEDQVRRTKANLVELGMDAEGRRKGILVTPLRLDTSDMQTRIEVARKQFSIFNKLVTDGSTQLINWGKNTQWAGRQLTVGLTVPMTMFATTTIKAFNDVDRELTRFQKVYGSDLVGATVQATAAIRKEVQALAVDIAGSFGIAAKETAALAADLAATGLEGQKLMDSIKQTTRLSVLGEIDRQDAMKTTLSLQNAFNMSTQELAESINFLNAVENQTSLSLQDLTQAIPKVGPVVRALGGDVKDLSVLMVAMKEGGINAAEGANALKSGLASLINPTKAGSEVAKQYGIDLENIVKKNQGKLLPTVLEFQASMRTLDDLGKAKIIEQLFGKYQFARISALFDNLNAQGSQTKQVIELMSASNSDLARVANEEIKTLTESAAMRFQKAMEAIKASLLPVGETIVRSVLPFMERLAGVFDKVVSFAQNLPGPVKSFLKVVTGLTAIAGPLIMMTGVLGNFLGYIIKGAMSFVNLGRAMAGLPTEKFQLLDDAQIAAAKATDTVTISIQKQKNAMVGLNQVMMDYYLLINKQAARTPNLFNATSPTGTIGGLPVVPSGARTLPVIRRQSGGPAWVPGNGSGDKIPALLEPGEFVVNRNASKQYGGLLEDINNGIPRFQSGGKIPRLQNGGVFSHMYPPNDFSGIGRQYLDLGFYSEYNSSLNKKYPSVKASDLLKEINIPGSEDAMIRRMTASGLSKQESEEIARAFKSRVVRYLTSIGDNLVNDEMIYKRTKNLRYQSNQKSISDLFNRQDYTKEFSVGVSRPKLIERGFSERIIPFSEAPKRIQDSILRSTGGRESNVLVFEKDGQIFYEGERQSSSGRIKKIYLDESGRQFRPEAERTRVIHPSIQKLLGMPVTTVVRQTRLKDPATGRFISDRNPGETRLSTMQPITNFRVRRRKSGGVIYAQNGMNTSAWVPGSGEGDRVPALLEPGEFVVNKKAAKQYGGMLEDMNWNLAPRFMKGTPGSMGQLPGMGTGAISGGLMAASMASSMMLPVNKFTDALNKSIMALSAFTGILSAMQMLGGRMGGGIGGKLSGIMTPKIGSGAETIALKGMFAKDDAISRMKQGGIKNKAVGASLLGKSMGLKAAASSAALLTNPIGLAVIATTALVAATVMYKKSLDNAKKSAEQAFGASKAEAEAFGVELKSIGETIKSNQEYTKRIGAQAQQSQSTSMRLDPEKEAILLEENKQLTKRLTNLEETKLGTTMGSVEGEGNRSAQGASLLTAKYASLLQQGFSEDDANIIVRTLAKASGAMDAYAESVNKFGMIKADDPASIIKAQMDGIKTFNVIAANERGGFAAGIKNVVEQINLLAPEDQYTGLQTLLSQMETLDTRQLQIAQKAIADMTKENYGKDSKLSVLQNEIQQRTKGDNPLVTQEQSAMISAALVSALETGAITDQQLEYYTKLIIDPETAPGAINKIEQDLDNVTRERQAKINLDIEIREGLAQDYEKINKEIIIKQNELQSSIEAKNDAIEKEAEAFKQSQKAGQKYIKGKQEEIKVIDEQADKEIEAIEKQTDAYLKSFRKQDNANKFRAEQRGTMLGGLGALAEGDVFGFLDARQAAEENARQFSASEEVKAIEEKRDAAVEAIDLERDKRVEAIQTEIDKRQEALEKQAEGHEAHMARLEKERETMSRNAAKTIAEMQATSDAIAGIQGNDTVIAWLGTLESDAKRAAMQAGLINYLIKNPQATVADALKVVRADLYQRDQSYAAGINAGGGERAGGATPNASSLPRDPVTRNADGGYISGAGTGTSDSIPAMLSNGEYVIKASSVRKFGKGAFDQLNSGEPVEFYADGGFVMPTRSGRNRSNYGNKGPLWSLGYHTGLDFSGEVGTDVLSVADGSVESVNAHGSAYGNHIMVRHNKDLVSLYAHLSKILVAVGSRVSKGQHIGEMGATGNTTGPHLHLEMGKGIYRNASNPLKYLLGMAAVGGEDVNAGGGERTLAEAIKLVSQSGQGTVSELTDLMKNGAEAVYTPFNGRQFGGSMTMNKPYLVGENGPEVVMPYGSGSRVDPRFSVPSGSSIATISQDYGDIISNNSYSNMVVNLSVSGVNDPNKAADRVIEILNAESNRRNHSRKMGR